MELKITCTGTCNVWADGEFVGLIGSEDAVNSSSRVGKSFIVPSSTSVMAIQYETQRTSGEFAFHFSNGLAVYPGVVLLAHENTDDGECYSITFKVR